MAVNINGRKVEMFRCHIDPCIGPKPKNAFTIGLEGIKEAELTPGGIYVCWSNTSPGNTGKESEHLVPYANVQSVRLAKEASKA